MKQLLKEWKRYINEAQATKFKAWHPSRLLIAGATSNSVQLYEYDPESEHLELSKQWNHLENIEYLAWSSNGNNIKINDKYALSINNKIPIDNKFEEKNQYTSYDGEWIYNPLSLYVNVMPREGETPSWETDDNKDERIQLEHGTINVTYGSAMFIIHIVPDLLPSQPKDPKPIQKWITEAFFQLLIDLNQKIMIYEDPQHELAHNKWLDSIRQDLFRSLNTPFVRARMGEVNVELRDRMNLMLVHLSRPWTDADWPYGVAIEKWKKAFVEEMKNLDKNWDSWLEAQTLHYPK